MAGKPIYDLPRKKKRMVCPTGCVGGEGRRGKRGVRTIYKPTLWWERKRKKSPPPPARKWKKPSKKKKKEGGKVLRICKKRIT